VLAELARLRRRLEELEAQGLGPAHPEDELALFRQLVEHSQGFMCVHDPEGTLLFVNSAAARALGFRPEDGVGWNLRRFLSPEVAHEFDAYLDCIRTQGVASGFLRLMAKDGTEQVWRYQNVRWEEPGRPPRVLGHAVDVTEQVRAERALRESEGRARELAEAEQRLREEAALAQARRIEAIEMLAGGIAHEFNNLLTVILGRAQLLEERLPPGDPTARDVAAMARAGARAAALTRQLLAFGRRQPLRPRPVSLGGLVRGLEPQLLATLGPGIALGLRLEPPLSPALVDPEAVERVVLDLAQRARQVMPEGGRVEIEVADAELDAAFAERHPGARPGPHVRLAIRDTGPPMDAAVRTHAFEPFFAGRERGPAGGLVLAAAYGVTKQLGGYIALGCEPGPGTTFHLYFPAATGGA
jgi:PAS domain S-box-containing protein